MIDLRGILQIRHKAFRRSLDTQTWIMLCRICRTPVPSEKLIFLVSGHYDRRQFALNRRATVLLIVNLLVDAGIDYRQFRVILDFGCGCGRILAGWEHELPPNAHLLGCDINPSLVEFCRVNIPFARTWTCEYLPPLNLKNGAIDFAYAASVFTHTTKEATRLWAEEMRRIIKPGGILMVSFHGGYYEKTLADLSSEGIRMLRENGFCCYIHGSSDQTSSRLQRLCNFYESTICLSTVQRLRSFDVI